MMFRYFGYGSNMNLASLKAKGVVPLHSQRATLKGWRLRFNVEHFFKHEGGVGNIENTNNQSDVVCGVLHHLPDSALDFLDDAEAYGYGYDRVEVCVTSECQHHQNIATTYVGMPEFINEDCRPSQRYLNIVVNGAQQAGLSTEYIAALRHTNIHVNVDSPTFQAPNHTNAVFDAKSLEAFPLYTALFGHVFDMTNARKRHDFLKGFFGGKDMTLFHLQRMDTSCQNETLEDIVNARLDQHQQRYLNQYLHEYSKEYLYVGRYHYQKNANNNNNGAKDG